MPRYLRNPYVRHYDINGDGYYDEDDLHNAGFNTDDLTSTMVEQGGDIRNAYCIPNFDQYWCGYKPCHRPYVHHIPGYQIYNDDD